MEPRTSNRQKPSSKHSRRNETKWTRDNHLNQTLDSLTASMDITKSSLLSCKLCCFESANIHAIRSHVFTSHLQNKDVVVNLEKKTCSEVKSSHETTARFCWKIENKTVYSCRTCHYSHPNKSRLKEHTLHVHSCLRDDHRTTEETAWKSCVKTNSVIVLPSSENQLKKTLYSLMRKTERFRYSVCKICSYTNVRMLVKNHIMESHLKDKNVNFSVDAKGNFVESKSRQAVSMNASIVRWMFEGRKTVFSCRLCYFTNEEERLVRDHELHSTKIVKSGIRKLDRYCFAIALHKAEEQNPNMNSEGLKSLIETVASNPEDNLGQWIVADDSLEWFSQLSIKNEGSFLTCKLCHKYFPCFESIKIHLSSYHNVVAKKAGESEVSDIKCCDATDCPMHCRQQEQL